MAHGKFLNDDVRVLCCKERGFVSMDKCIVGYCGWVGFWLGVSMGTSWDTGLDGRRSVEGAISRRGFHKSFQILFFRLTVTIVVYCGVTVEGFMKKKVGEDSCAECNETGEEARKEIWVLSEEGDRPKDVRKFFGWVCERPPDKWSNNASKWPE